MRQFQQHRYADIKLTQSFLFRDTLFFHPPKLFILQIAYSPSRANNMTLVCILSMFHCVPERLTKKMSASLSTWQVGFQEGNTNNTNRTDVEILKRTTCIRTIVGSRAPDRFNQPGAPKLIGYFRSICSGSLKLASDDDTQARQSPLFDNCFGEFLAAIQMS